MKIDSIYDLQMKKALGSEDYMIASSIRAGKKTTYNKYVLFNILGKLLSSEYKLKTVLSYTNTQSGHNIFSQIVDNNITQLQQELKKVAGEQLPKIKIEISAEEIKSPLELLRMNNRNYTQFIPILKNTTHASVLSSFEEILLRNTKFLDSCEGL